MCLLIIGFCFDWWILLLLTPTSITQMCYAVNGCHAKTFENFMYGMPYCLLHLFVLNHHMWSKICKGPTTSFWKYKPVNIQSRSPDHPKRKHLLIWNSRNYPAKTLSLCNLRNTSSYFLGYKKWKSNYSMQLFNLDKYFLIFEFLATMASSTVKNENINLNSWYQCIVIRKKKIIWKHRSYCWYFHLNLKYLGWLYKTKNTSKQQKLVAFVRNCL